VADSTPGQRSGWREELAAPITQDTLSKTSKGDLGPVYDGKGRDWIRDCRIKLLADLLSELYGWDEDSAFIAAKRCIEARSAELRD
jgi:hypothetical protein